jgi:integrase
MDERRRFPDAVDETTVEYAANVASKLDRYILPVVGDVALTAFTIADAQRVMERLPPALSKSTRKQTALFLRRVLSFAVYPLQLVATNPIPAEFMPKAGRGRERNMLFVDEDRTMLGCVDSPIALRLLFGFQSREGMRREEACALEWRSVDLDRGWVYLDRNKTDAPRDWPLDPGVAEALARWRAINPRSRYVFGGDAPVSANKLAKVLRKCLPDAGVDRPQLHEPTKERMRAGTHDLRATFVTLALAQGKGEGWIRRRTGQSRRRWSSATGATPKTWEKVPPWSSFRCSSRSPSCTSTPVRSAPAETVGALQLSFGALPALRSPQSQTKKGPSFLDPSPL